MADALGGDGGTGATCCTPPQAGGKGGRGGDATSTAGSPGAGDPPGGNPGDNGIRGGHGGHGGDGEPAGAGGDPGLGQGTPAPIPDGDAGQPGGGCPCNPPSDAGMSWTPDNPFAGTVITFTGSATGTMPMTFTWDFGDYAQGQGNPIEHVYEMPGEYRLTLTVTNACGGTVVTATVAVDPSTCIPPYETTFTWIPFYPVTGEPITFTGRASGTLPIDYIWDFGDGSTAVGDVVIHVFELPMDYLVTLTATNDCGLDALTQVVVVEPPLAPRGLGRTLLGVSPSSYRMPYYLPLLRR
jgi:chitodextrinase